ncbi:MAG: SipW-dependent-type signal peptide-containing protein [Candidatus Paceibacterota bacterium]
MNILKTIDLKRAVLALAMLALVASAGFLGTRAFFSDTETSQGNVFAAGSLDLEVGIENRGTEGGPDPLAPQNLPNNGALFVFEDLIPGDMDNGHFKLQSSQDAWACIAGDVTANYENTRLDAEQAAGDSSAGTGPNGGELSQFMQIAIWEANGTANADGLVGPNEVETLQIMSLEDFANGDYHTLQDSSANGGDNPLVNGDEYNHEFAYCFGEMTLNGTTLECDGGAFGGDSNQAQTDSAEVTIHFYAEQMENNDNFVCSSLNATSTSTPTVASTYGTGFEPATFSVGNIDGQDGWSKTGPFDSEVVASPVIDGVQSLRISNSVTSGSFGDQTFTPELASGAGETGIGSENYFEAEFEIESATGAQQSGLALSVSPDDGNGSRMSYLSFADEAGGIRVTFYDVTNAGPLPTVSSFDATDLGLLDYSSPHTIKFEMEFVDGPGNDIVRIYIDGSLAHTGTSWEDYYRYDPEQTGNGNQLFSVDSVIFRAAGTAVPANAGNGYIFDNVDLSSGTL